jgi:putative oxidoreductase
MTATDQSAVLADGRLRAWFVAAREWLAPFPLSIFQLAMRISIGMVFFNSGALKVNSFQFAVRLFQDEYQLPLIDPTIAARLAAFTEITFPLFLFAGLATRLATLPLLGMTFIIQFVVYPDAWAGHLLWATLLGFPLVYGPGAFSIDHAIEGYLNEGSRIFSRAWPWLAVGGSLCLVLGIAVITFPALIPASGGAVTVIQWLLMLAALVLFVAAAATGGAEKTQRVAATG